jgi:hypothetical protein
VASVAYAIVDPTPPTIATANGTIAASAATATTVAAAIHLNAGGDGLGMNILGI